MAPAEGCASGTTDSGNGRENRIARHGWPASTRSTIPITRSARCPAARCGRRGGRNSASTTGRAGKRWVGRTSTSSRCSASPTATTASTSGRSGIVANSKWSCSTPCSVGTTSARARRPLPSRARSSRWSQRARWPRCWTGRSNSGLSSSTPVTPRNTVRTGRRPSCATPTGVWRTCSAATDGRLNSPGTSGSCTASASRAANGCGSTASRSLGCASWPSGSPAGASASAAVPSRPTSTSRP